jgi:hypothetical protein
MKKSGTIMLLLACLLFSLPAAAYSLNTVQENNYCIEKYTDCFQITENKIDLQGEVATKTIYYTSCENMTVSAVKYKQQKSVFYNNILILFVINKPVIAELKAGFT